jgi:hypothetical protein
LLYHGLCAAADLHGNALYPKAALAYQRSYADEGARRIMIMEVAARRRHNWFSEDFD